MGSTSFSGPLFSTGSMDYLPPSVAGTNFPVPDYNPDAGPSVFFQGTAEPDVRFILESAKLNGSTGVQPCFRHMAQVEVVNAVPAAFGTATIAALAHTTSGTAMTLVAANAAGISKNVPFIQWTQSSGANAANSSLAGSGVVTVPIMLDFGFAFGTTTASSKTVTVSDSTLFSVGMPLVMAGAATATTCLLTWVTGITDATHITINDAAGASATPAIGHGNIWPGAPLQTPRYPTAHLPYIPGGPGLYFNGAEGIARGVSVTTGTGGSGGNITISGWDIYGQVMTEVIAASATGSTTVYGKKAFKGIKSATPAFTDGTGTYSIGTSDVFGYNRRSTLWELTEGSWAGANFTTNAGWTGWVAPASGDVRGTLQVSAQGGGTGYGTNNSNGSVSGLVMTGRRLFLLQTLGTTSNMNGTNLAPQTVFGPVQT